MVGEVVSLFAFDVANEIVPNKIGKILGKAPELHDIRRDHTVPRDIPIHRPLSVEPGVMFSCDGQRVRVQVRAFDVGVVSVVLRVAFQKETLGELKPFHRAVLSDGRDFGAAAKEICERVVRDLGPAIPVPSPISEPEAYTVFCVTAIDGVADASAWLDERRADVAGLLSDMDARVLAGSQVEEVFRHRQSFEKTDSVVVDWDSALVLDLAGYVDDVLYVLELANLQLEEFRVMDDQLDKQLDKAYALVETSPGFWIGTPSKLLRQLRSLTVDFTKLADEVSHITKFLGDWYLARVYLSARERFHLEQWRSSVEQRLQQLDDLYSVVRAEVNERRMLWLEVIIVVFFAIDIALIFIKK
jgi:hypothetical protein